MNHVLCTWYYISMENTASKEAAVAFVSAHSSLTEEERRRWLLSIETFSNEEAERFLETFEHDEALFAKSTALLSNMVVASASGPDAVLQVIKEA